MGDKDSNGQLEDEITGLEVREGPEVLRNIWDGRNPPENPEKKESTLMVGC